MKPICSQCTRAARTADTPSVKVRVEELLVWRTAPTWIQIRVRCHGAEETIAENDPPVRDEDWLGRLEVFRGP